MLISQYQEYFLFLVRSNTSSREFQNYKKYYAEVPKVEKSGRALKILSPLGSVWPTQIKPVSHIFCLAVNSQASNGSSFKRTPAFKMLNKAGFELRPSCWIAQNSKSGQACRGMISKGSPERKYLRIGHSSLSRHMLELSSLPPNFKPIVAVRCHLEIVAIFVVYINKLPLIRQSAEREF